MKRHDVGSYRRREVCLQRDWGSLVADEQREREDKPKKNTTN